MCLIPQRFYCYDLGFCKAPVYLFAVCVFIAKQISFNVLTSALPPFLCYRVRKYNTNKQSHIVLVYEHIQVDSFRSGLQGEDTEAERVNTNMQNENFVKQIHLVCTVYMVLQITNQKGSTALHSYLYFFFLLYFTLLLIFYP